MPLITNREYSKEEFDKRLRYKTLPILEGCLSLPDLGLEVPRFRNVKVKYLTLEGREHVVQDDNSIFSSVIQHELDHLDGILMTDRMVEPVEVEYGVSSGSA